MEYVGVIAHLLTIDPNFLGHPSIGFQGCKKPIIYKDIMKPETDLSALSTHSKSRIDKTPSEGHTQIQRKHHMCHGQKSLYWGILLIGI